MLFEGLPATVIQSQVFARLRWIEAAGIASFDVLAFAPSELLFEGSERRIEGLHGTHSGPIAVERGMRPAIPGSRAWNRRLLRRWLSQPAGRYDFIHARTDYAAAVAGPLANSLGVPLLWDCRGDSESEFLERSGHLGRAGPLVDWRARQYRLDGEIAARTCTAASFVSTRLQAKWRDALSGKPGEIIPCLGDERVFHFDAALRARERARLGYAPGDVVLAYSGSLGDYQGVDLMIEWFKAASARLPTARLLVLTPETARARARLEGLEGVTVISAPFEAVNGALNAADYGFLLRPATRTNQAAFPTKFAEYGLAGLKVIMSHAVPDCRAIAQAAGNLVPQDCDPAMLSPSTDDRQRTMEHYRATLTHTAMSARTRDLFAALVPVP